MTYIIAHRGASAEAPENTIAAIEKAISMRVDFIEIDIRLSREGIPIVFHDISTGRTVYSGRRRLITDFHASDIKRFDAGKWFSDEYIGHKVPTFAEVIGLDRRRTGFMIEIKEEHAEAKTIANAVASTIKSIEQDELWGPLILGSFSPEIIHEMQKKNLHHPLMGIISYASKIPLFTRLNVKYLAIRDSIINQALVHRLNLKGIKVWAWTVDKPERAKELVNFGVEGIITNDPRKIAASLKLS